MDGKTVLGLPMLDNDADAATVRDYLRALLSNLWDEGEGFSGKRPFGNSAWEYDLYRALVKGGAIKGEFEEPDYPYHLEDEFDKDSGDRAIFAAIEAL